METEFMTEQIRGLLMGMALCVFLVAGAQADGVGTTGANFLKVGVGARPLAMGSAFSALADDANAINWNPAAMSEIKQRNVTASYNSLLKDQNQGFLAYAAPSSQSKGAFGVGLNYLIVSNIEKRAGDTETADSTFNNSNFALVGSYGRPVLIDGLSLGVNLKYIRTMLDTFSGNAMALDAGALYHTGIPNLAAAFTLQNFGSRIGPDPLPFLFKGGAAYKLFGQRLVLASDLDWQVTDQRAYWDIGGEFWAHKQLALRFGYQFGRGQDRLNSSMVGIGFGFGLKFERVNMDYAFLPFGNLGDTHRITFGMNF